MTIKTENLSKYFGKNKALDNINLTIDKNTTFALLGNNGAGKTTLIRCLLGLLKPTKGSIYFENNILSKNNICNNFSYLPESFFPPGNATCKELLNLWSDDYEKIENVLEEMSLIGYEKIKIKHLSRGMLQRLGMAIVLIRNHKIIILDEPFLGLDITGRKNIINIIHKIKQGKTIIISSHILYHLDEIIDKTCIIHEGKIVSCDSLSNLYAKHSSTDLEEIFFKELNYA